MNLNRIMRKLQKDNSIKWICNKFGYNTILFRGPEENDNNVHPVYKSI